MENERFELQTNVAIPLKWQFLAPKMLRVARTEQQIKKNKTEKKNRTIPDLNINFAELDQLVNLIKNRLLSRTQTSLKPLLDAVACGYVMLLSGLYGFKMLWVVANCCPILQHDKISGSKAWPTGAGPAGGLGNVWNGYGHRTFSRFPHAKLRFHL